MYIDSYVQIPEGSRGYDFAHGLFVQVETINACFNSFPSSLDTGFVDILDGRNWGVYPIFRPTSCWKNSSMNELSFFDGKTG